MKKVRGFTLTNGTDSWTLDGAQHVYIESPSGLGYKLGTECVSLKNGFYKVVDDDEIPQGNIVGDLVFVRSGADTAYKHYYDFVRWLAVQDTLFIDYKPDSTTFRCDVTVEYLNKGELKNGVLACPVSFRVLTPWYKATPKTVTFTANNPHILFGEVLNEGDFDASFVVSLTGVALNDVAIASGSLGDDGYYTVIESGAGIIATDTLEYSTLYDNCYIRKRSSGNTVTDLLDKVALEGKLWVRVPPHQSNVGVIIMSTGSDLTSATVTATLYEYFRSV